MSGFATWAQSPAGTSALTGCALVAGMILGYLTGRKLGWRAAVAEMRQRREERAAVRQVRQWREPPEVHHEKAVALVSRFLDPQVAHEAWLAHTEQAIDLANDDPTVSAWTADMAASMDRWLAEHVYGVPYSADELWSGQ